MSTGAWFITAQTGHTWISIGRWMRNNFLYIHTMTTTRQQKGTTPYRASGSLCWVKGSTCKEPHIVYSDRKRASGYLEVRVKGALLQLGMKEFSGMMEIFFLYLDVVEITWLYTFVRTHQSGYFKCVCCIILNCISIEEKGRESV